MNPGFTALVAFGRANKPFGANQPLLRQAGAQDDHQNSGGVPWPILEI